MSAHPTPALKTCTKCKETKPATLEFFHKNPKGKFGLRGDCKLCVEKRQRRYRTENQEIISEKEKKYRLENKEKIAERKKKYYLENKERIDERIREYRLENLEIVNEREKKYRIGNKEKTANRGKKWRLENQEKNRERNKKYRLENKEKIKEKNKKYRLENQEKIRNQVRKYRSENREIISERRKKRHLDNPDEARRASVKRRALKFSNEHSPYTEAEVLSLYGTDCHICNQPIDLEAPRHARNFGWELGLQMDHVIPISKGGPDTLENVKPAHGLCNNRKGSKV
jgi:5-methylcytosine-specific restriction endonuclease McrA